MATDGTGQPWDVIADSSRRAIVLLLAERPRAVGEIAELLPISRPAVSQHLAVLKTAGIAVDEVAGTRRIYRLDPVAVIALRDQLDTFWARALSGFADLAAAPTDEPTTVRPRAPIPRKGRR